MKPSQIVQRASVDVAVETDPIGALLNKFPQLDYELIIYMVTPKLDLDQFTREVAEHRQASHIMATRTAGEISETGYSEGMVVALGFPKSHFGASICVSKNLDDLDKDKVAGNILRKRQDVGSRHADWKSEFAFLLVDGLSLQEDALVSMIAPALGSTQLFGGSSGDGLSFENAPVHYNGSTFQNGAVLAIVRTNCEVVIMCEDHLSASEKRLVVTGAVPQERLVTEINAEPAAREYARIVGIDPDQLSPFIFASHPIVVSIGDQHHVRSIQQVVDNRYLRFFSSIDEGMVLTVANIGNISDHLSAVMDRINAKGRPDLIFACDCILRKLEAEQSQEIHKMSKVLSDNHVMGFSTYGEQHNFLHVNQTLTGIAIYPPKS